MRSFFWAVFFVSVLLAQTTDAKNYKIALANIPPYAMMKDLKPSGILVDATREAVHRLGHTASFFFYPWPRAIENLKAGHVDAITPFFKTEGREKFATFHGNGLLDMELVFLRKTGSNLTVNTLEKAMHYRMTKVSRVSLGQEFDDLEKNKNLRSIMCQIHCWA